VKVVFVWLAVKVPVGDMVSQLLVVQFCSDIWAVALVLVCAVTVNACEAGAAPLAVALNVNAEELNVRTAGVAVTFNVTVEVCVTEPAVTVIVPLQVVPAASPV
jgi:hypothetical protein